MQGRALRTEWSSHRFAVHSASTRRQGWTEWSAQLHPVQDLEKAPDLRPRLERGARSLTISLNSPADQGSWPERPVRGRPYPPPFSPRVRRRGAPLCAPARKLPPGRGVLAGRPRRTGTGDREFRAGREQPAAFVSVANLRGSDSLPIRPRRSSPHRDQSSTTRSLNLRESPTFAVTRIKSWTRAIAAICPSAVERGRPRRPKRARSSACQVAASRS